MKNIHFIYLALVLTGFSLTACKKGDNDPAFSLATRRARMAGTYTVNEITSNLTHTYSNGTVDSTHLIINGKTGEEVFYFAPNVGPETTYVKTISVDEISYRFKRDGSWESTYKITSTWQVPFDEEPNMYIDRKLIQELIYSGTWSFLDNESGDFKNKERVVLNKMTAYAKEINYATVVYSNGNKTESEPSTYISEQDFGNNYVSDIYEIDRLAGKEMILKLERHNTIDFDGEANSEIYSLELHLTEK